MTVCISKTLLTQFKPDTSTLNDELGTIRHTFTSSHLRTFTTHVPFTHVPWYTTQAAQQEQHRTDLDAVRAEREQDRERAVAQMAAEQLRHDEAVVHATTKALETAHKKAADEATRVREAADADRDSVTAATLRERDMARVIADAEREAAVAVVRRDFEEQMKAMELQVGLQVQLTKMSTAAATPAQAEARAEAQAEAEAQEEATLVAEKREAERETEREAEREAERVVEREAEREAMREAMQETAENERTAAVAQAVAEAHAEAASQMEAMEAKAAILEREQREAGTEAMKEALAINVLRMEREQKEALDSVAARVLEETRKERER